MTRRRGPSPAVADDLRERLAVAERAVRVLSRLLEEYIEGFDWLKNELARRTPPELYPERNARIVAARARGLSAGQIARRERMTADAVKKVLARRRKKGGRKLPSPPSSPQ